MLCFACITCVLLVLTLFGILMVVPIDTFLMVEDADAVQLENLVGPSGINRPDARFAIVTLYGGEQECLKGATLENKQEYCRVHGCALYVPEKLLWTEGVRAAERDHYAKLLALQKIMENSGVSHEWLVWSDADSVFWTVSTSPQEALDNVLGVSIDGQDTRTPPIRPWDMPAMAAPDTEPNPDDKSEPTARAVDPSRVMMTSSWPLNTGCFFIRNSKESIGFLEKWWAYDLPGKAISRKYENRWNDQGALIDILWTDPASRRHIAYYDYRKHPLAAQIGQPHPDDSWILHSPGNSISHKFWRLTSVEQKRKKAIDPNDSWDPIDFCWLTKWVTYYISGPSRVK